jgi:hypothetical protein
MNTNAHPWIVDLRNRLDALETALLGGDAGAVERASGQVQAVLQQAPKTADLIQAGDSLRSEMQTQAQRFAQLRQAVMRANGLNERALHSLLPGHAQKPTYGRMRGARPGNGPSQTYLSA